MFAALLSCSVGAALTGPPCTFPPSEPWLPRGFWPLALGPGGHNPRMAVGQEAGAFPRSLCWGREGRWLSPSGSDQSCCAGRGGDCTMLV